MNKNVQGYKKLSRLGAWSFAIGTSVGWGSLVVTSNTYLMQAGPLGSILGLLLGTLVMLLVSRNYSYMMRCYPEGGGAYIYTREVFGYDQGFLIAWFVCITYFAMLWANATSLPLFARIFLGGMFRFGKMYTFLGYDVFFGEVILSMGALLIIGFLRIKSKRGTDMLMIALALLFSAGIIINFIWAAKGGISLDPAFVPDSSAVGQVLGIAVISPWAFIGFESISHRTDEFSFESSKIFRVLSVSVISTVLLYILVTALSVTAYPPQFSNWLDYIRHLDSLSGIEALPAFYAANRYMGNAGLLLLMLSLLALVITSLIGNITALSKLFYSLAKDRILPQHFAEINQKGVPEKAVWLVVGVSLIIPFVGRTAIGWIVDVTTIGAVLIYGFVSACVAVMAKDMGDKKEMWCGRIGLGIMIALGAYFLLPNFVTKGSLAKETYFLFIVWSVLGFLFFRSIMQRDKKQRFGTSISVWVALLALVLIISLIWMRQSMLTSFDDTITTVKGYYEEYGESNPRRTEDEAYFTERMDDLESDNSKTMIMASTMFGFALLIMLTNHSYMNRRSKESEIAANRDPMTGVMSKHAYLVKEKELDADIKEGKVRDFSVVVCDVNGLKKINDTLGHKAGDEYIRKASKMITEIFQHSTIYRVGGDEFLVILTGRDYSIREELMSTLHDTSVAHISTQDAVVSGGISDYTPEDHAFQDVFKRADDLMYEEKKRLKSLGAVTRDDESDAQMEQASSPVNEILEEKIINIRRHVLIVEDEPINQELLGHVLEDQFDVLYSADGEEALEIIKSRKDDIALVMLDLMLPVLSGYEVLRIMNADDELRQIPVIVLTVDSDAELDCLRLGAMDFIPKPYPIWEVVKARVNKCIELSENRGIIQSTERDSLTHLFNIDYFYRYVKMFDQHYWDMSMDAVVLNVNRFHMINERYGKNYGDSVLRRIGKKVREISREVGGVGCHKGADIFLIYCPHREDYGDILDKVSAGLQTDKGSSSRVRLRLGVYAEVDKNCEIERRFDRAKLAADSVKNTFAKPVGYYDEEMGKISLYKEHLLEDLAVAFETGQFEVYFQPKYDIRGDQPVLESAEALVRWNHPEMGMIMPNQFIPLMEENGLVLELDTFVWKQTGARLQEWKKKYGFSVPVSVNVSRVDMLMPDLKSIFKEILDTYEISGKDLILEITESAYTGDSEQVIATANELRSIDMGLRIEMDDFGTGYSSLGMLAHLPIDALKLDMSFISSAFAENMDVRMIELIIDIADYLHVPVIAEGVETEEQYMVLKAMGCNLVQGFYFSHPLPNEEFEKILLERKRQTVEPAKSSEGVNLDFFKELLGHFENVYYVDTSSGFYLEFFAGEDGSMQIVPGGKNFFKEAKQKLLTGVVAEDFERCLSLLEKENMMTWLDATEPIDISFTKKKEGQKVAYHLATIELLQKDSSHLVIGVGPAKEA